MSMASANFVGALRDWRRISAFSRTLAPRRVRNSRCCQSDRRRQLSRAPAAPQPPEVDIGGEIRASGIAQRMNLRPCVGAQRFGGRTAVGAVVDEQRAAGMLRKAAYEACPSAISSAGATST
jgi:hypothetical protein